MRAVNKKSILLFCGLSAVIAACTGGNSVVDNGGANFTQTPPPVCVQMPPVPCDTECPTGQQRVSGACVGLGTLAVSLTWSADSTADLDLWVQTPSGGMVSRLGEPDGSNLDRDSTDGPGPENIFWEGDHAPGLYHVCVVDYISSDRNGIPDPSVEATVTVRRPGYVPIVATRRAASATTVASCTPMSRSYVMSFESTSLCLNNPECVLTPRGDGGVDGGPDGGLDGGLDSAIPDSAVLDGGIDAFTDAQSDVGDGGPIVCNPTLVLAQPTIGLRNDNTTIATGDVNMDGNLDVAITARLNNQVSVLRGNGNGTFMTRVDYACAQNPLGVALGDLNGDGHLDLVTAQAPAGGGSVGVRLGSATGTFGDRVDVNSGMGTGSVALGDINMDGDLDAVVANIGAQTLAVLLGNGSGGLGAPTNYPAGTAPGEVRLANLNADGFLDAVVVNAGDDTVSIYLGQNGGTFASRVSFASGVMPSALDIGDVDGDADQDIVVTHGGNPSTVRILLGDGAGAFLPQPSLSTAQFSYGIRIADMDADGRADLVTSGAAMGVVALHRGLPGGGFAAAQTFDVGSDSGPTYLAVANFNADPRPDVLVLLSSSNTAAFLANGCL